MLCHVETKHKLMINNTSCNDQILLKLTSSELKTLNTVKITDIYETIHQQKSAVLVIARLLEIWNTILESQQPVSLSPPASGISLDTAPPAYQGSGGDN